MIEVRQAVIGSENVSAVSARDLHTYIESKQDFSTWIKARIEKYDFVEGVDFKLHKIMERESSGFQLPIEYFITLDMAKEISMVENNDKGKQARKYFIECEKQLKQQKALSPAEMFLQMAQLAVDVERRQIELEATVNKLDAKIEEVKAKASASPDEYYSISGYAGLRGVNVDVHKAGRLGKVATRFSNENGYFIGKAHSEIFGTVNSYHLDVLTDIFKKEK